MNSAEASGVPYDVQMFLAEASDDELYRAAEAMVDAALRCHSLRCNIQFTEYTRNRLVAAAYDNPLISLDLFAPLFDPAKFLS